MAAQLSELQSELWQTREDLARIKASSAGRSARTGDSYRSRLTPTTAYRNNEQSPSPASAAGLWHGAQPPRRGGSEPRSAPTSGSRSDGGDNVNFASLKVEGDNLNAWTAEAASIAVKLIEEVKTLRWERDSWRDREARWAREREELRARGRELEAQLADSRLESRGLRESMARVEDSAQEHRRAAEQARAELRAANDKVAGLRGRVADVEGKVAAVSAGGATAAPGTASLGAALRQERAANDTLVRELDAARAAAAQHEEERRVWHESGRSLEELRRSWAEQMEKVSAKVRAIEGRASRRETRALERAAAAEAERDRLSRELRHLDRQSRRDDPSRRRRQRDDKSDASAAAAAPADARRHHHHHHHHRRSLRPRGISPTPEEAPASGGRIRLPRSATEGNSGVRDQWRRQRHSSGSLAVAGSDSGVLGAPGQGRRRRRMSMGSGARAVAPAEEQEEEVEDLEGRLEQSRARARLARIAEQQERLRREAAEREKEEAVRQLHRLMAATRCALSRKESRLQSSRLETELVWNALTQAVR